MLVKDDTKPAGYQLALITTDLTSTPAQIVERYADRWAIEVCFEEAKHQAAVGDARNRTQRAVKRTVPFQFLAMTLTIIWYQLYGNPQTDLHERRRTAPWYRQNTTISYTDMLAALRRELIRHEFWAQAHPMTTNPELAQPQSPSALAAA